jgi:hypothetical protein
MRQTWIAIIAVAAGVLSILAAMVFCLRAAWLRRLSEATPRCERCGSRDVRSSHAPRAIDRLYALFELAAFRCRACHHRFHRPRYFIGSALDGNR